MMNHGNGCGGNCGGNCAATCQDVNQLGWNLSRHHDRDRDRRDDRDSERATLAAVAALSQATAVGFANAQVLQLQTQIAINEKFAAQAAALAECCCELKALILANKPCGCD